jgi:hypothetical protein
MRRDFDIFEKFPDGSTLWRACVRGQFEARRKMNELSERSENQFFMIDIQNNLLSSISSPAVKPEPNVKAATAR